MDSKITRMEEDAEAGCSRYSVFKYFLVINFLIFLIFCCFSMWGLHQLNKAMRSQEPTIRLTYIESTTPSPPDDNVNSLLDVVSNAMKEFGVEQKGTGPANLTDFEIHIIREYAKMKRNKRSLGCANLNITVDTGNEDRMRVQVKPARYGQGNVNVRNVVNYHNGTSESRVEECAFDVTYEPKEQT